MILNTDRLHNKFYPYLPMKWNKPDFTAIEIYLFFKRKCEKQGGKCYVTTGRISRKHHCSHKTANNKIRKLADAGLIKREQCWHDGQQSNKISILKFL